ncbi:MAG: hypothetical protein LH478_07715 [Chitinophagaceae bacterium]|nr:hypothetical protein [Chitinophagaceae bacterium]
MRVIKLGILSVVVLFGLITAMSMLLPSQVIISRAIDISKPMDSVYQAVANLTRWQGWMDNYDAATTSFSTPSKGKGAYIKMGKVRVDITAIEPNKMDGIWKSADNRPLAGSFNFVSSNNRQTVTVQWQFIQKVQWYPWEKFASITSDKVLGPYMEKSLDNLKKLLEDNQAH